MIVLHAMRWPDEIRDPSSLIPPSVDGSDEETDRALALMDTMTRDDLDSAEYRDTGQLVDLMAALNESVAKAKEAHSAGRHADVHEMPTKQVAKTAPAKRTVWPAHSSGGRGAAGPADAGLRTCASTSTESAGSSRVTGR
ncbi:hypothetical protein AB0L50_09370 [Streptomyces flaveolus]|uniref:hypothetical protein n=1 Tax=Streptomyces flaveolus TaxID=67297 RepID=UPI00341C6276